MLKFLKVFSFFFLGAAEHPLNEAARGTLKMATWRRSSTIQGLLLIHLSDSKVGAAAAAKGPSLNSKGQIIFTFKLSTADRSHPENKFNFFIAFPCC